MKPAVSPVSRLDRIVLQTGLTRRDLTVSEYFALPLSQRIRCVLDRTATFYAGDREIDRQEALDALRVLRATG